MTYNIIKKIPLKFLATSLSAAALAACSIPVESKGPVTGWSNIEIAESVERLELYSQPHGLTLSARDETAVAQFLQAYGRFGDGPLYVNMPSGHMSSLGAQQTQQLIKRLMGNVGLAGAPMQSGQYQTAMGAPAPVVVSYRRLKTLPHDCRKAGNMASTYSNQPHSVFGCSYYANLAAMIEDPRQLLEPYTSTPPDMARRSFVYEKYIAGESPASEQPERQDISAGDE